MAEITPSKIRWLLDNAYPKIGTRPIARITAQAVLAVLRAVEATGRIPAANRRNNISRLKLSFESPTMLGCRERRQEV